MALSKSRLPFLVLVEDGRLTWTDCDEAGDYVVPNVLSPRDLVFRPDIMDETVPHTNQLWRYRKADLCLCFMYANAGFDFSHDGAD